MYDYVLLYYEELAIDEDHLMLHDLMDLLHLMQKRAEEEVAVVVVVEVRLMEDHRLQLIHLMQEWKNFWLVLSLALKLMNEYKDPHDAKLIE
jgi:hypothetical protein